MAVKWGEWGVAPLNHPVRMEWGNYSPVIILLPMALRPSKWSLPPYEQRSGLISLDGFPASTGPHRVGAGTNKAVADNSSLASEQKVCDPIAPLPPTDPREVSLCAPVAQGAEPGSIKPTANCTNSKQDSPLNYKHE